jgi:hypothetical protein
MNVKVLKDLAYIVTLIEGKLLVFLHTQDTMTIIEAALPFK